jgi:hypothetical protein
MWPWEGKCTLTASHARRWPSAFLRRSDHDGSHSRRATAWPTSAEGRHPCATGARQSEARTTILLYASRVQEWRFVTRLGGTPRLGDCVRIFFGTTRCATFFHLRALPAWSDDQESGQSTFRAHHFRHHRTRAHAPVIWVAAVLRALDFGLIEAGWTGAPPARRRLPVRTIRLPAGLLGHP